MQGPLPNRESRPAKHRDTVWVSICRDCSHEVLLLPFNNKVWEYCPGCENGRLWYRTGLEYPPTVRNRLMDAWKDIRRLGRNLSAPFILLNQLDLPGEPNDPIHELVFRRHYALVPDYALFRRTLSKILHKNYVMSNMPHVRIQYQIPMLLFPLGPAPGFLTGFQTIWHGGFGLIQFTNYFWTEFGCIGMHRSEIEHVFLDVHPDREWFSYASLQDVSQRWPEFALAGKLATVFCGAVVQIRKDIPPIVFPETEDPDAKVQPRHQKGWGQMGQ